MVDINSDDPLCTSFFLNTSLLLCHRPELGFSENFHLVMNTTTLGH